MIIVGFIIKNSNLMSHHTLFNSYGPSSDAKPINTYGLMTCGFYEILFSIRSWCCMLRVVVTLGIFKCCLINNKNHMFFWSKKTYVTRREHPTWLHVTSVFNILMFTHCEFVLWSSSYLYSTYYLY